MSRLEAKAMRGMLAVLGLAATVFTLGVVPGSAEPPDADGWPLRTTFINRHPHEITAMIVASGQFWTLGTVAAGERGTFAMPQLEPGARYYLVADCPTGERVASDPIAAEPEAHPHFTVGRTSLSSWVRFPKPPDLRL